MQGRNLIDYLWELSNQPLSVGLSAAAQKVLLDTLGCSLYGAQQPWVQIVAGMVGDRQGPSTALGFPGALHPSAAALVNGTGAHGFELDDYIEGCFTHAGATIIPASFATAEAVGCDGARLLSAIVAGYELMGRLGLAMGKNRSDRGLHYTGQLGAVGAALSCGLIRRFDVTGLRNVVGIAASMGGGIKAFTQGTGGMVKRLHAGRAAEAGVVAAELASNGFTGPQDALDGDFGLIPALGGDDADSRRLTSGLGDNFLIERNWTKMYPCCAVLHAGCQAIEDLRRENSVSALDISTLEVAGSSRMVSQNCGRTITDMMSAQYSMPFTAAAAMLGDASDPDSYDPNRANDSEFGRLMNLVTLAVDQQVDAAYPDAFGAHVTMTLNDGRQLKRLILYPKGTANALVTSADVETKFRSLAAPAINPDSIDRVVAAVRGIKSSGTMGALTDALRGGASNLTTNAA
jgi:2-methylcitrate dehydratase PrpD